MYFAVPNGRIVSVIQSGVVFNTQIHITYNHIGNIKRHDI